MMQVMQVMQMMQTMQTKGEGPMLRSQARNLYPLMAIVPLP